jgi:hypothetical protein
LALHHALAIVLMEKHLDLSEDPVHFNPVAANTKSVQTAARISAALHKYSRAPFPADAAAERED